MSQQVHAVTGAFGYSGKYIATRLLQAGHKVITLTNSPDRTNPFEGKISAYPFQFDNVAAMAANLEGVDVLYNTYWVRFNHPLFTHADAVKNTIALFEAAKMAGVKRVVHISISNANETSHLEYFRAKGKLEKVLQASGLSYAILRPAVLFGHEDILINNIAWSLRLLPIFCVFGNGKYRLQPIYIEDLAKLAVEQGASDENIVLPAIGPETYTYKELVKMIGKTIGCDRPIFRIPVWMGYMASVVIGKWQHDVFATREEIEGLMEDMLYMPDARATGTTSLAGYIKENAEIVGKKYASELARRVDRKRSYSG